MTNTTIRHTISDLPIDTAIHYTGDMANQPADGVIVAHRPASRFAQASVDIRLEDGRECLGIWPTMFDASIGQRFYVKSEWDAIQAAKIEEMRCEFEAVMARQAVR